MLLSHVTKIEPRGLEHTIQSGWVYWPMSGVSCHEGAADSRHCELLYEEDMFMLSIFLK